MRRVRRPMSRPWRDSCCGPIARLSAGYTRGRHDVADGFATMTWHGIGIGAVACATLAIWANGGWIAPLFVGVPAAYKPMVGWHAARCLPSIGGNRDHHALASTRAHVFHEPNPFCPRIYHTCSFADLPLLAWCMWD